MHSTSKGGRHRLNRRGFLAASSSAGFASFFGGVSQALAKVAAPAELKAARAKLDGYEALHRVTHRLASSWERYLRSTDPETGPSPRALRIIGFTAPEPAVAEMEAASLLTAAAPAEAEADRAARALIHFYRDAAPLMVEAGRFFESYSPLSDQGVAGQVMHRRIKSVMQFTVDARNDLFRAIDAMRGAIEPRELAALAASGKGAHWHVRAVSVEARKVRDVLPFKEGPFDPGELTNRLAAFSAIVEACQAHEALKPGAFGMFAQAPKLFHLGASRLQAAIAARPDTALATRADIQAMHTLHGQVIVFADLFFANYPV